MIRVAELSHRLFMDHDFKDKVLIDMTCGQGQDTLFLAGLSTKVFAFDIQKQAIEATFTLLYSHGINHVKLIHDDHQEIERYITEPVAGAIYNLGYLPKGNKTIKTSQESTLTSLTKLLNLLDINGIVVIVVYQKHEENESMSLLRFVERLPGNKFDVLKLSVLNKELAPYIIHIEKKA